MTRTQTHKATAAARLAATAALAKFISDRSGLKNAAVEEALGIVSEDGSGRPGSFWSRTRAGKTAREQESLARWAHCAVRLGWLRPADIPSLMMVPGGRRAIQPVLGLLLRMARGEQVSEQDIDANLVAWREAYGRWKATLTEERNRIKDHSLKAAKALGKAATALKRLESELIGAESHLGAIHLIQSSHDADELDPDVDLTLSDVHDVRAQLLDWSQRLRKIKFEDTPYAGLNDLGGSVLSAEEITSVDGLLADLLKMAEVDTKKDRP